MAETVSRNETNLTGREISRKIQFYGISIKVSAKKGKNNYVQLTSDEILQLFNKIKELSKKLPKEITREVLLNKVPNDILEKAFGNNIPEVIKLEDITNIEVERELLRDSAFIPLYEFKQTEEQIDEESQTGANSRPPKKYLFMRFPSFQDDSMEFDGTLAYPIRGQLIMSRADALPLIIKNNGQSEDLKIPEDALGLGEITHFMIFEDGTVLLEFNRYGPRVRLFEMYLKEKLRIIFQTYPDELSDIIEKVEGAQERGIKYIKVTLEAYSNKQLVEKLKAKNVKIKSLSFVIAALAEIDIELLSSDEEDEDYDDEDIIDLIRRLVKYIRFESSGTPPDKIAMTLTSDDGYEIEEALKVRKVFEKLGLVKKRGTKGLIKLDIETSDLEKYDLLAPIIETRIVAITESPQSRKIVSSIFYSRMEEAYRKFQEERLLNHA